MINLKPKPIQIKSVQKSTPAHPIRFLTRHCTPKTSEHNHYSNINRQNQVNH